MPRDVYPEKTAIDKPKMEEDVTLNKGMLKYFS